MLNPNGLDNDLHDLVSIENLQWAWNKVRRYYLSDSGWRDELEIAEFESNLGDELTKISSQFRKGTYRLSPMRPIAQPKLDRTARKLTERQYFWPAVRDQVAWVAAVNIIGPLLDDQMPSWSFGNRLYRSAWMEDDLQVAQARIFKVGPYRRSSEHLYKKFAHSWPLYRRYAYLSLRAMFRGRYQQKLPVEDAEERILAFEAQLPPIKQVPYLRQDYWAQAKKSPCWATIDFSKFYPNIAVKSIKQALLLHCPHYLDSRFQNILDALLAFSIDTEGWSADDLVAIGLTQSDIQYGCLPTGLMVSGFLANVAMLPLDLTVKSEAPFAQVAHFRYVDDHIVLATNFESLVSWIQRYEELVAKTGVAKFNWNKVEPEGLQLWLIRQELSLPNPNLQNFDDTLLQKARGATSREAVKAVTIDLTYPKPFLTKTLARVSQLANLEFDLLDEEEQSATINDLELLLIADIEDLELPKATRVAFAATLIARLVGRFEEHDDEISKLYRSLHSVERILERESRGQKPDVIRTSSLKERQERLSTSISISLEKKRRARTVRLNRSFDLLLKAIHENPDKLKLWRRAIDFCVATGCGRLASLFEEIDALKRQSKLAGQYFLEYLDCEIAVCLVEGARQHFGGSDLQRQESFLAFFMQVLGVIDKRSRKNPTLSAREEQGFSLLLFSLGLSAHLLRDLEVEADTFDAQAIKIARDWGRYIATFREDNYFLDWVSRRGHRPEHLLQQIFWADKYLNVNAVSPPPQILVELAAVVPMSLDGCWRFWEKYPSTIPNFVWDEIVMGRKQLFNSQFGWLLEAAKERTLMEVGTGAVSFEDNANFAAMERARVVLDPSASERVSLIRWVDWVREIEHEDPWNPSIGEWTALEIVRKIARLLISPDGTLDSTGLRLFPGNVFLSTAFMPDAEMRQSMTWEKWRNIQKAPLESLVVVEAYSHLHDSRYYEALRENGEMHLEGPLREVRAAGLILMGLLRRNFELPGAFNSRHLLPIWDRIQRRIVQSLSISSMTERILQACLLYRIKESSYLQAQAKNRYQWDEDDLNDPPPISSLYELTFHIEAAQRVLEEAQVSLRDNKPRQMLPADVSLLTKSTLQNDDPYQD